MTPVLQLTGLRKVYAMPRPRGGPLQFFRRPAPAMLMAVDGVDLSIMPGEAVGLSWDEADLHPMKVGP